MDWAENGGVEGDAPQGIQDMPVDQLKDWAVDQGAGPSLLRASRLEQGKERAREGKGQADAPQVGVRAGREKVGLTELVGLLRGEDPAVKAGGAGGRGMGGAGQGAGAAHGRPETTDQGQATGGRWGASVSDETARRAESLRKSQGNIFQERALLRTDKAKRDHRPLRGGVNETVRLSYEDGTTGYFKPFDGLDESCAGDYGHRDNIQPMHEAAAWQLAREMGPPYSSLVAPCVIAEHEGRLGSISYGVMGRPLGRADTAVDDRQKNDAAFFDCLIGQQDRHPGNALADNRGITLIDHGFAFSRPGKDRFNFTEFVRERHSRKDAHLSREEIGGLSKFLDSGDGLGMKNYLEPARYEGMRWRAEQMLRKGRVLKQDEMDRLAKV